MCDKEHTLAARSAPEAGKAVVKPLEWEAREKPDFNGNRYWRAQTTFDWGYRIYFEDNRYVFQQRGIDFATLDDAKAACQADYEQRIRSALASVPAPSGAERLGREFEDAWDKSTDKLYETDGPQAVPAEDVASTVGSKIEALLSEERQGAFIGSHQVHAIKEIEAQIAAALAASEAEAISLRRKLEEARKALEPFAAAQGHFDGHVRDEDTVEIALRHIRAHHVRAAARTLSGASE